MQRSLPDRFNVVNEELLSKALASACAPLLRMLLPAYVIQTIQLGSTASSHSNSHFRLQYHSVSAKNRYVRNMSTMDPHSLSQFNLNTPAGLRATIPLTRLTSPRRSNDVHAGSFARCLHSFCTPLSPILRPVAMRVRQRPNITKT